MNSYENNALNQSDKRERIATRIVCGIRSLSYSWLSRFIMAVFIVTLILAYDYLPVIRYSMNRNLYFFRLPIEFYECLFVVFGVIAMCILLICLGSPIRAWACSTGLRRSGFINGARETPILTLFKRCKDGLAYEIEFTSKGIPIGYYRDHKEELASVLNMNIVEIKAGKNPRHIKIKAVKPTSDVGYDIPWDNKFIPQKESMLVLGISILGTVIVDLDKDPHFLVGSASGGGKSIELKCLAYQAYLKGWKVILVDYKGGVEFADFRAVGLDVITDEDSLLTKLNEIMAEMNHRQELLAENHCKKISEYNEYAEEKEPRILIVFDEVAECLDKSGLTGDVKKKILEIEGKLSSVSRLGRATGIHLCLGMQRPDANVLTGQIKTNITTRLCGISDPVLAEIIHGNRDASKMIDISEKGRFLKEDGTLLQGFHFKEKDIK